MEIFKLVGSVFVRTDKADESLQKTDKKAEGLGHRFGSVGKSVGKFALGAVGAVGAVGTAMVALAENTREYRTEQGKLQTAFETENLSAEQAKTTYQELNGILGDSGQAVEAASHLAKLADTQEDLSTWTDICTGVYGTFGASLPIESLTEASNETAKTGTLTGALSDALNWAGVSEDEFQARLDACNGEQERQALITDTLNGLYSEAADHYREVNGEVINANKAQDNLNAAMAKVGGAVEPVISAGKQLLADVLEAAMPLVNWLADEAIPKVVSVMQGMADFVRNVFAGNFKKAFEAIKSVALDVFGALTGIVRRPINGMVDILNGFIRGINSLRIPDWVPVIGGASASIPQIPYLARGGILEKGQVGFLEGNGAEAVVPLENNKKWISAVARDMDAHTGGAKVLAVLKDIRKLLQALVDMGIVLDTGALVGGLAGPMDRELGRIQARKARGAYP